MSIKPVVFVPGFPASELIQASKNRKIFPPDPGDLLDKGKKERLIRLLSGPDNPPGDIVAGEPIRHVLGISKQAESLYDILRDYGYTAHSGNNFAAVGWDWRRAVDDIKVQNDLIGAIDRLAREHASKVVVICHSTGGLVVRRLLEMHPEVAGQIEQILSFGIPWAGTLKAVRYLARGESFGFLAAKLSASEVREIMSHCQAAYDLFPPDPAKTDMRDLAGKPLNLFVEPGPNGGQKGPLVDLAWVPKSPDRNYMRQMANLADSRLGRQPNQILLPGVAMPPITNVVGWGVSTDTTCEMDASGKLTFLSSDEGDGTVASASASWLRGPGVRTFFLPIGVYPTNGIPNPHARIWDSPPVLELFDRVLRSTPPEPWVCAAADGDQAIDRSGPVTLRLSAADEQGRPLPNARGNFVGLPQRVEFRFGGAVRMGLVLRRTQLRPNVARDLFRFVVEVTWDTGSGPRTREIPVLIRV
jgi:pimeloyl-ACP methyl ester carboxylesterase